MDQIYTGGEVRKGFLSHVFSTTEEGKAELFNVAQYAILAVLPIFLLNKFIQRFIPEADLEKSSIELLLEILVQLLIIFLGVILVHRVITYIPTYSGFKYENLALIHAILPFLVIVLSIQSKLGLKTNILYDRFLELWNGPSQEDKKKAASKKQVRFGEITNYPTAPGHSFSQADSLDDSAIQTGLFPPAPIAAGGGGRGSAPPPSAPSHIASSSMGLPDAGFSVDPLPSNFAGSVFSSY
jgi:hypothetical protein